LAKSVDIRYTVKMNMLVNRIGLQAMLLIKLKKLELSKIIL